MIDDPGKASEEAGIAEAVFAECHHARSHRTTRLEGIRRELVQRAHQMTAEEYFEVVREPLRKGKPEVQTGTALAYGYLRVSGDEQAKERLSLHVQKERIIAYCKMKRFNLAGFFIDDGVSAKVPLHERPRGALLCDQVRRGDQVVVCTYDRAFRTIIDALVQSKDWLDHDVTCHFVEWGFDSSEPCWKLFAPMIAMIVEREREIITARTHAAILERRHGGQRWANRALVGFKHVRDPKGGRSCRGNPRTLVVVDEAWWAQVRWIVQWHDEDKLSFHDIGRTFLYLKEKPLGGHATDWSARLVKEWYKKYKEYQRAQAKRANAEKPA